MKNEIMDLFRAIQNERTIILRFCHMRDRYKMVDHRCDALQMINDFEAENVLSDSMRKFLRHRICYAAKETGLM